MKHRFSPSFFLLGASWAFVSLWVHPAHAQSLSGRLTTSVYLYERSDTTATSFSQSRLYQALQFSLMKGAFNLQTYAQVDGDVSTSLAGDGKFRMFHLYFEWQPPNRKTQIKVGRQPVFAGVGVGSIDGVQARVQPVAWLKVKGYAGGLVPRNQRFAVVEDLDRNHAWGGQVQIVPFASLRGSLSYARKRQLREGYSTVRSDSIGNLFTQEIQASDRAYELASADLGWTVSPGTDLYGRADFDIYSLEPSRAEVSLRSDTPSRWAFTGTYTFRSPRMPWNSIFAVFNTRDNHEIEGGVSRGWSPSLRTYAEVAGVFYAGDNSLRSTLGMDLGYAGFSYVHRAGYGGSLDGVNASAYRPLLKSRVTPSLQASWASYRPDSDLGDRTSLFSGAAGAMVQLTRGASVESQVQVLHNRYYDNDVRFILRLQYWFFSKPGSAR